MGVSPRVADASPLSQITVCCGRDNHGVVYGNGTVFIACLDDVVVALDASTGQVVWETTAANYRDNYSMTLAPQYLDGLVIVDLSGAEYQVRGEVLALNANTGNVVWNFYTTLPSSYAGHSWEKGGATVWTTLAVDPNLGLVYITTGNPGPDLNDIHRAGKNLYSSSIVPLDIFTGQVRWYFQVSRHVLWDYDNTMAVTLFTVTKMGRVCRLSMTAAKMAIT